MPRERERHTVRRPLVRVRPEDPRPRSVQAGKGLAHERAPDPQYRAPPSGLGDIGRAQASSAHMTSQQRLGRVLPSGPRCSVRRRSRESDWPRRISKELFGLEQRLNPSMFVLGRRATGVKVCLPPVSLARSPPCGPARWEAARRYTPSPAAMPCPLPAGNDLGARHSSDCHRTLVGI
ncbi:hypothetical protein LZ30DRAFT_121639 [Colletotrichum cereale]|nr:hypothetical protein LZ30DRAFT_121639 [Colletotrichum cereale]